ncbi:hypothetical protein [Hymenobacter koreensis]|uniref:Group III truncated hemoglobin n=1 Tax=Hymenobacter koreensis TaxID=1084523 RepID=A0ABP8J690_9BACT
MVTSLLPDLNTPAQRRYFVRLFADRTAADSLLGPAFARTQAAGFRYVSAQEYAWWETALTGSRYTGRPPHSSCPETFNAQLFARWCRVLDTTLDEHFHGPLASAAKGYVRNTSSMLAHLQLARQVSGVPALLTRRATSGRQTV